MDQIKIKFFVVEMYNSISPKKKSHSVLLIIKVTTITCIFVELMFNLNFLNPGKISFIY